MTTATTDEWLANCPQSVRDFANKIKAGLRSARPASSEREAMIARLRDHAKYDFNRNYQLYRDAADMLEADAQAYEQGRYDESMAQGPNPWPDDLAQQVAVPPGYALVPIEPTLDMLSIGDAVWVDSARVQGAIATKTLYSAMLKAAPQPAAYVPLTDDLVLLVWRLAASLRRAKPGSEIAQQAIDFINSKGLTPSPLRQVGEQAVRGKT